PEIRSVFPVSCGTQKLWITSWVTSRIRTAYPVGMWMSLAVTIPSCGYWTLHHHWYPSTVTSSRARPGGDDRACMSWRVRTHRIDSTRTGNTTPPPTTRFLAQVGVASGSGCRRRRQGRTPTRITAPTNTTTAADTENMNHHRPAMRAEPGPCGSRTDGAVWRHDAGPSESAAMADRTSRRRGLRSGLRRTGVFGVTGSAGRQACLARGVHA